MEKSTTSRIVDDVFVTLRNDIEKIQKSPTLYISSRGGAGSEQLAREMVNNMVDEHLNKNTLSDGKMSIYFDGKSGMWYFTDTGRGINFNDLENACTVLQSGTKMDRAVGGASGGEYGVGLTATNALSERFEITSTREGKCRHLRFSEGKKVEDRESNVDPNEHGLCVGFKPSKIFLGEEAGVPIESFTEWLKKTVFTFDPSIQITFTITDENGNETFTKVYQNTEGIAGFIPEIIGQDVGYLLTKPIVINNQMSIIESGIPTKVDKGNGEFEIQLTEKERNISVQVAFNYVPSITEPKVFGFTNMIEQIDGGVHVNTFKMILSSIIHKAALESLRKNEKLNIVQDDALIGLVAVVNLNTTMSTGFESQTKHKLGNRNFISPLRKLYSHALEEFFDTEAGKKELKKIVEFAKLNARIRSDAADKRKKVKTSLPTLMDSKLIGNYVAANLIGTPKSELPVKLELYLVEGDSAGGQARKARFNPDYQGILNFTGKPDNFYSRIMSSQSVTIPPTNVYAILLDQVIGCGYGKHFDEEKLIYDKILFGFDADVDGDHMSGLVLSSIYAMAPDLILHGHCYRVITPLYKIAESQSDANKLDKTNPDVRNYLWSKSELFEQFELNCSKYVRLKFSLDDDFISLDNMRRFLRANRDYYQLLDTISSFESAPKELFEFIAVHPKDFKTRIKELDSELTYRDGTISGCYKGDFVAVRLSKSLMEKLAVLTQIINVSNNGIYQYEFFDRKGTKGDFQYVGRMTIGEIMEMCQKYSPYIIGRYKGWGEMSKYEMEKFAMNPNFRRLTRYTVADVERFKTILDDLFLDSIKRGNVRKSLVQHSNLSLDDIDN